MTAGKINKNQYLYDCVSVLDSECDLISEKAAELDKLAMAFDSIQLDNEKHLRVENLVNSIYQRIFKLHKMEEEYIFPEMKLVMPEQSSIEAMQEENRLMMKEYIPIKELLTEGFDINSQIEKLQIHLISWVDLIQRDINKKENILYPELYRLSESITDKIYNELIENLYKEPVAD